MKKVETFPVIENIDTTGKAKVRMVSVFIIYSPPIGSPVEKLENITTCGLFSESGRICGFANVISFKRLRITPIVIW